MPAAPRCSEPILERALAERVAAIDALRFAHPGDDVTEPTTPEVLTVLYDGACPLCRREIAHLQGLAEQQPASALCFVDVSACESTRTPDEQARLLARFHVQGADGRLLDGAAAFVAMWARLPGWRWLARFARLPGALAALEWAYRGFLRVRPRLQALARQIERSKERSA
ncbi:DUF393 domain-containing protein [Aquabacterium lacunae]|uniref:DUF393 domain-containing protein n=1 Tax=Aquabacterium lacunae TaxID=2528630 RepID=A0A4Q9H2N2_9BURK|nr:DUF393 domain-containing protein [Aquabacterium lacunae]TBO34473.1 DUF393 domain-containing protein [Aquabacterium lacunae]